MASIATLVCSVSFKACPQSLLNSLPSHKSYGPKTSVSFRRANVPRTPALRVTCAAAKPETVEKVMEIVKSQLSIKNETVSADTKLTDLGADSLDAVEIVMRLEEKFNVSVNQDNAETITTIHEAAELIERLREKATVLHK